MTHEVIALEALRIWGGVEVLLEDRHKFVSNGELIGIGRVTCDHRELANATMPEWEVADGLVGGCTFNKWGQGEWENHSISLNQGVSDKVFDLLKKVWPGCAGQIFNLITEAQLRELIAQGRVKVVRSPDELKDTIREFFAE